MEGEQVGVYVCLTRDCARRNAEVRHPWSQEWPLAKRQRKCRACRQRMLFTRVLRVMSAEAKAKLREITKRPKRPQKVRQSEVAVRPGDDRHGAGSARAPRPRKTRRRHDGKKAR